MRNVCMFKLFKWISEIELCRLKRQPTLPCKMAHGHSKCVMRIESTVWALRRSSSSTIAMRSDTLRLRLDPRRGAIMGLCQLNSTNSIKQGSGARSGRLQSESRLLLASAGESAGDLHKLVSHVTFAQTAFYELDQARHIRAHHALHDHVSCSAHRGWRGCILVPSCISAKLKR